MNVVYCVYAYPEVEGANSTYVERVFRYEEDAENYMRETNEKAGYNRVVCIDRMHVDWFFLTYCTKLSSGEIKTAWLFESTTPRLKL